MDGTLIDPVTGRISSRIREALKRLQEKGIKRCIVTGRPTTVFRSLDVSDLTHSVPLMVRLATQKAK